MRLEEREEETERPLGLPPLEHLDGELYDGVVDRAAPIATRREQHGTEAPSSSRRVHFAPRALIVRI